MVRMQEIQESLLPLVGWRQRQDREKLSAFLSGLVINTIAIPKK